MTVRCLCVCVSDIAGDDGPLSVCVCVSDIAGDDGPLSVCVCVCVSDIAGDDGPLSVCVRHNCVCHTAMMSIACVRPT